MCIRNIFCQMIMLSIGFIAWALNVQAAPGELKVGVFECPPFAMKDEGGAYAGLNLLLLERTAEQNRWQLRFTEYDLEGLLEAVSDGTVDIGASCLSITPEREEQLVAAPSDHLYAGRVQLGQLAATNVSVRHR